MSENEFLASYIVETRNKINEWLNKESKKIEEEFNIKAKYFVRGGKRFRPILTVLVAQALDENGIDKARDFALAVEFMQSFSLAADDIIDHDETRRGQPAAWVIEGLGKAFFAAIGGLVTSVQYLFTSPNALKIGVQTLQAMARGAINELSELKPFTRDFLINTIILKTGVLFATATQLGAIAVDAPMSVEEKFRKYGLNLGIAYQIQDDLNDIVKSIKSGKPVGDISMRNMTYGLYLIHENLPDLEKIVDDFIHGKMSQIDFITAIAPAGMDIVRTIRAEIRSYIKKAIDEINGLDLIEPYKTYLFDMPSYVVDALASEIEE